jgi:hypothetical protein
MVFTLVPWLPSGHRPGLGISQTSGMKKHTVRPDSKKMPRKIRYAQPVTCQDGAPKIEAIDLSFIISGTQKCLEHTFTLHAKTISL